MGITFYYLNIPVWLYVRRINFHAPFNLYRLSGWVWKYIFVLSRGAITDLAIAPATAPDARLATILRWLERTRGLSLLLFSYTNIKCICIIRCTLTKNFRRNWNMECILEHTLLVGLCTSKFDICSLLLQGFSTSPRFDNVRDVGLLFSNWRLFILCIVSCAPPIIEQRFAAFHLIKL